MGLDIAWMVGLLVAIALLGGMYVKRSAFSDPYIGDVQVFFRAAWAARTGENLYTIEDDKGLMYHYPPLLAVALMPWANPPADADTAGRWIVPWPATVTLWYVANVGFMAWGVCLVARAIERRWAESWVGQQPRFGLWWWLIRLTPILFACTAIGRSLARGQMGSLLILALCGMAAGLIDRKSVRAGLWLSLAICIKIIPAFLLLYPLWRRDGKCLGGCAAGLVLGLIVIPAGVMGPAATLHSFHDLATEVLLPGATESNGEARATELTAQNRTDSNSIMTTLHNLQHFSTARPSNVDRWVKLVHWGSAIVLTLATLAAAGWKRRPGADSAAAILLFLGALTIVHMVISPVFHPHYFAMSVVPITGLLVYVWQYRQPFPDLGWRWQAVLWSNVAVHLLTALGIGVLRDSGLVLWGALFLWGVCVWTLWKVVRMDDHLSESVVA